MMIALTMSLSCAPLTVHAQPRSSEPTACKGPIHSMHIGQSSPKPFPVQDGIGQCTDLWNLISGRLLMLFGSRKPYHETESFIFLARHATSARRRHSAASNQTQSLSSSAGAMSGVVDDPPNSMTLTICNGNISLASRP